ncbi:low density lipoprotein receptor adapter protein 1-like isoform X1 [Ptychodera flava]|uniref:low density lipoprotein receptor adapter protein 1-like isoform X1 n=1 Tax=Ptychodera flava TaxID=63121 RepID=UPI003969F734
MMKNRFGKSAKHQKLTEDPSQTVEPLLEGVTFYVKYLGMFIVDKPNDEQTTADAVKKIVSQAKSQNRVRKVSLTITPKGIEQVDLNTKEDLETISIYRISYCTADKNHDKVFGYIARNLQNETLECHAFLCNKRKHAEELCLTVAQAFNVAFETELWDEQDKDSGEEIKEEIKDESSEKDRESPEDFTAYESGSPNKKSAPQAIPGVKPISNGTSSTKSSPSPQTSLVSSGSAFSLSPPPRHPKVVSSSAPSASSSHMIERHHNNNVRTAKLLDVPGQPRITTTNYMPGVSDATQLLDKWNITDDSNLDESFSKLAETRSNPKLHDVNKSDSNQDIMKNYSQGNPTQQSKSVEDLLCL